MITIDIVAVLNTFKPATTMSAKDISVWLAKCFPYSAKTIYDNLSLFVKTGIVVKSGRTEFAINGNPIYYKKVESVINLYHNRMNNYAKKYRVKLQVI